MQSENGVRLGDVRGGGVWMGVKVPESVSWQQGDGSWKDKTYVLFEKMVLEMGGVLYFLHFLVSFLEWNSFTSIYFEVKRVCRFGGYLPLLCRDVSPMWILSLLKMGTGGVFLLLGSVGLCFRMLKSVRVRSVLDRDRNYFRKVAVIWALMDWWMPVWLRGLLGPWELAVGYVALGKSSGSRDMVVGLVVLVCSKITHLPLILFLTGLPYVWDALKEHSRVVPVEKETVVLRGWPAAIFGPVEVSRKVNEEMMLLMGVDSQMDIWPKVRLWAFAGDKLATYHVGLEGCMLGLPVSEVQRQSEVFSDDKLRITMRICAKDWWKVQDEYMHGKPAATVLEAFAFLVMKEFDEQLRVSIFKRYKASVVCANAKVDEIGESDSEDSGFKECKE